MDTNKRVWIAWEKQRRSYELAKEFNCTLYIYDYEGKLRYPKCIIKSTKLIFSPSVRLIFVQNPSMILATLACIYKIFLNKKIIVDRHSTFPFKKKKLTFSRIVFILLHKFTIKMADLTIVTNKYLAEMAENINGKAFVLPDKLPALQPSKQLQLKDGFNIFLISSFNKDEPVIEVINAAYRLQDENVNVYVSGNYTKLEEQVRNSISDNVVFTGFVSDEDFVNYLYSSDAIIVLTKVDYCMLCGCYEAVSASKPLITSNKQVLQEYFYNAIFINNNENDIVNAVIYLKNNYNEQVDKISELKKALSASWRDKKLQLEHIIKEMEAG